jgi:hypothetical protein
VTLAAAVLMLSPEVPLPLAVAVLVLGIALIATSRRR